MATGSFVLCLLQGVMAMAMPNLDTSKRVPNNNLQNESRKSRLCATLQA